MRRQTGFFQRAVQGFLVGVGCILPGVSGGVMAVSFGLYLPMLDAILGFFHDVRTHFRFLLPIALGISAGILLGARLLMAFLAQYETLMLFLFTGFILGGIPQLLREAQQNSPFRLRWLFSLALGVALALPLALMPAGDSPLHQLSPIQSLLCGMLEGFGTVVPGVSTSMILLRLGWYQAYLHALSAFAVGELVWIAAGFGLSAIACMRGVQWLFDHVCGHAYYAILGFVLVTIVPVFPGLDPHPLLWADIGMLIIGILVAHWMGTLESTKE